MGHGHKENNHITEGEGFNIDTPFSLIVVSGGDIDEIIKSAMAGCTYWCSKVEAVGSCLGAAANEQVSRDGGLEFYPIDGEPVILDKKKFRNGLNQWLKELWADDVAKLHGILSGGLFNPGRINVCDADAIIQYALFDGQAYSQRKFHGMEKGWTPETFTVIKELDEIYPGMCDYGYRFVNPETVHAADIHVLYFMVCLEPKSVCYGQAVGAFVYKDGRVFQFHYNIHSTHSKGPHISNTMTNIGQAIVEERHGEIMMKSIHTDFGRKAFWLHTPVSCLNDEERSLRELMKSIQAYCRKENLCAKLCKTDKEHEQWEFDQNVIRMQVNTVYGITNAISYGSEKKS